MDNEEFLKRYTTHLNENQLRAVQTVDGPVLLLAVPGRRYVELSSRSNQYGYLIKVAEGCERETVVLYRDNESAIPLIDILDRRKISFRRQTGCIHDWITGC